MQSFGAFYNDNRTLAIAVGVAVLAVVLLYAVYRLLFGRRLRMANGRSRQPRLGVVDAYDVDRQRQLVLVRRDNVEHLIMIGGPNDLLIESAIVRAQPGAAIPVGRDREASPPSVPLGGIAPQVPALPGTSNGGVHPPVVTTGAGADQNQSAAPVASGVDAAEAARPEAAPAAPVPEDTPPPALPPRPAYVPRTPFQPRSPGIGSAAGTAPGASRLPPLRTPGTPLAPRPPSTGPRPAPTAPLSRGTSAASLRREPLPGSSTNAGSATQSPDDTSGGPGPGERLAPEAALLPPNPGTRLPGQAELAAAGSTSNPDIQPGQPVTVADPPPRPLPMSLNTIESLEEEMAKLLGRPTAPPIKPD